MNFKIRPQIRQNHNCPAKFSRNRTFNKDNAGNPPFAKIWRPKAMMCPCGPVGRKLTIQPERGSTEGREQQSRRACLPKPMDPLTDGHTQSTRSLCDCVQQIDPNPPMASACDARTGLDTQLESLSELSSLVEDELLDDLEELALAFAAALPRSLPGRAFESALGLGLALALPLPAALLFGRACGTACWGASAPGARASLSSSSSLNGRAGGSTSNFCASTISGAGMLFQSNLMRTCQRCRSNRNAWLHQCRSDK